MDSTYPSLKPLPAPPKPKVVVRVPKGMVRQEDYEKRLFRQAFKKATDTR